MGTRALNVNICVLLPLNVFVISSSLYALIAQQNDIIILAIPTNDFRVNVPSLSIHTAIKLGK